MIGKTTKERSGGKDSPLFSFEEMDNQNLRTG
jgi:hypothetical protein